MNEPVPGLGLLREEDPPRQSRRADSISNQFLETLARRPLVLDAGIGTRLIAFGLKTEDDDPALWNLTHSDDILAIHRRDIAAGADAILTNTFGANRRWLSRFGRGSDVARINFRAVELARQASGPGRWVIGDLGPEAATQVGDAAEQARILIDSGVDALMLETYLAEPAAAVVREFGRTVIRPVPILVSLREWPACPADFKKTAHHFLDLGASVLGINCQPDITAAVSFAARMSQVVTCPLSVKPGVFPSGGPGSNPSLFSAAVPALLASNVRLLGGCCGTTHHHVAALAAACASHYVPEPSLRLS